MRAGITLRLARPGERDLLDALCFRAKAHWGYDSTFMAKCRPGLRVPAATIRAGLAVVAADAADRPLGVAALGLALADAISLDLLFVEPGEIGTGLGAALFRHAAKLARARRAAHLEIESDPFATGFYDRMGARRIGDVPSGVVPGRMLPLYRLDLGGRSRTGD
jgi:GNAT superfamily N-acetyltransferase